MITRYREMIEEAAAGAPTVEAPEDATAAMGGA